MRKIKLSILIPVFNGENYIEGCLNGVLRQDLNPREYEVIVMDDGSTDNTYEKAKAFAKANNQIKVFTQQNIGLFNTRNKLLGMANGEYVYNLDVDDVLVSNRFQNVLEFAFEKNLDFVGFKSVLKKEIAKSDLERNDLPISKVYQNGAQFIMANPNHRVEVWWYIVKHSFLNDHNFVFVDNQNNADVLFTYEVLLKAMRIGYFDWISHYYYQSSDSIMRSSNFEKNKVLVNTMHEMILSLENLLQRIDIKNGRKEVSKVIGKRMQRFAFGNLMKMIKIGMNYEFIQSKLKDLKASGTYPFIIKDLSLSNFRLRLFAVLANSSFFIFLGTQFIRVQKNFRKIYRK